MTRVTIRDVAQETKLSITTVSLVLNDRPNNIPAVTKERIFAATKKLGYEPNQVARALVTQQSNVIGLLIPDISNVFFAVLAKSVEQEASRYDYRMLLCDLDNSHQDPLSYLRMLYQNNVKSVIMAGAQDQVYCREVCSAMEKFGMKAVFADQRVADERFDWIAVDNRKGAMLAMDYLLGLGHRRIGCIQGPESYSDSIERMEGVEDACSMRGVTLDKRLVFTGDFSFESGIAGAAELINRGVTAIFAFNDMMAYGIWEAARNAGKRIPQDISVVGFDDILFSRFMSEPLTTVYQPVEEIGRKAVQILMRSINGKRSTREQILLEPTFVERSSAVKYEGEIEE
jgi:LacI family transcriptional regulator